MKKVLKRIYFEGEAAICAIMFAVMLAVLTYQVVLRFIFKASNVWSEELARYLFIFIVFLASSYAVLEKRHIKIDTLEKMWPGITRPITAVLGDLIWIGFSGFLCVRSLQYVMNEVAALHVVSLGLKSEMWIWWMALPVGNGLITLRLIISFIETWIIRRPLVKRDEDGKGVGE